MGGPAWTGDFRFVDDCFSLLDWPSSRTQGPGRKQESWPFGGISRSVKRGHDRLLARGKLRHRVDHVDHHGAGLVSCSRGRKYGQTPLAAGRILLFCWFVALGKGFGWYRHSVRRCLRLLLDAANIAAAPDITQPHLGHTAGAGRRRRLVWTGDRSQRLALH